MIPRFTALAAALLLITSSAQAGGGNEIYRDTIAEHHRFVGYVKSQGQGLPTAEVFLYVDNSLIMWTEVDEHNRFDLELPTGAYCTIEVQAPGFHPKRVQVNTETDNRSSITYRFKVEMISTMETYNAEEEQLYEIDYPAALLVFENRSRRFVEIDQYTEESYAYFNRLLEDRARNRFGKVRVRDVEPMANR